MTSRHFDIAIIGSGIAGGALAVALKDSGLSVLLLDRRAGPLDTARVNPYSRQCSLFCLTGVCLIG